MRFSATTYAIIFMIIRKSTHKPVYAKLYEPSGPRS